MKSNFDPKILGLIQKFGFSVDCFSQNEVRQALKCGFKAKSIVFDGVGKTDADIKFAIKKSVFALNCEHTQELAVIDQFYLASKKKPSQKLNIFLRINPDIEAHTHNHLKTGFHRNKFGVMINQLSQVFEVYKKCSGLNLNGIHFHIGSQITKFGNFRQLVKTVNKVLGIFEKEGIKIEHINLGGGLGVNYADPEEFADFENFFKIFLKGLKVKKTQTLHFELGRSIVNNCGSLISRVLFEKVNEFEGWKRHFLVLDAGMTELIRPALYQASHVVQNLSKYGKKRGKKYDVVGPICESGDVFQVDYPLPVSQRGDIFAIRSAGAYGQSMASRYNMRNLPKSYYGQGKGKNAKVFK